MENDETVPTKKRKLMHSSENGEVQPQENLQEQLRQFDVLDEVHGDESGSEESIGMTTSTKSIGFFNNFLAIDFVLHDNSDGCSSDSESDGIDIENMLDEGLPDDLRDHKKEQHYVERYKTILDGMALLALIIRLFHYLRFGQCQMQCMQCMHYEDFEIQ